MDDLTIAAVLLVAGFTQGVAGFGFGLVAMSVLPFVVGVKDAVPIVALCGTLVCATLLWETRRHVRISRVLPLFVGAALGVPLGVLFLQRADPTAVTGVLGGVLVLYSLHGMHALRRAPRVAVEPRPGVARWGWPAGFLAGVLGGGFNVGGPPAVIYAAASAWPAAVVRGTLQAFFLLLSLYQLTLFTFTGVLRQEHLTRFGIGIPAILLGVLLGALVARRIAERTFRWVLFALLFVLGARFLVKLIV